MAKKEKKSSSDFDYTNFEKEALEKLKSGKGLIGSEGILKGLIKHLVESALEGELDHHLKESKKSGEITRRNGNTSKNLKTSIGEVNIKPPRDRSGSFEPQLVGKWERDLNGGLDSQVLELYSLGNSYGDIQLHLSKMYGVNMSTGQLSSITEKVWAEVLQWQKRVLKPFYILLYLDAIHFHIREDGLVKTKAVYTIYGVDADGQRDLIGLHVGNAEGAKEWGRLLEKIRDRGVEDVLFFAVDGLAGFKQAIQAVYPNSIVQRCIVHMVRNSIRFVDDKDCRELIKDLKAVYTADEEEQGLSALIAFEGKWNGKYPEIAKAWKENWIDLTAFFGFNWAVRKLIYTTNAVESIHRMMRKTTKTKAAFVNEKALVKLLYLSLMRKEKVWKRRIHSYKAVQRCLAREFGERFSKHLQV